MNDIVEKILYFLIGVALVGFTIVPIYTLIKIIMEISRRLLE